MGATLEQQYADEWHDNPVESIIELLTELRDYCPEWAREKWNLDREVEWAKKWLEDQS